LLLPQTVLCLGGELPGALTYTAEVAPQRSGLACGVIILCVNGGVLVATLGQPRHPARAGASRCCILRLAGGLLARRPYWLHQLPAVSLT
jgi:hypothetical protein